MSDQKNEVSCAIIAKHFEAFQQCINEKAVIVLVPFFHVLVNKFVKQMQADHGTYYGITDFSMREIIVDANMYKYKETEYDFVINGKIVHLQTSHVGLDMTHMFSPNAFKMISGFKLHGNSYGDVSMLQDFFEEFVSQQNFAEIKNAATDIIRNDPEATHVGNHIEKFYL